MSYGIQPIEYFGSVNSITPVQAWEIAHGAPKTVYFTLTQIDSLGSRRFIPPAGTAVGINFFRSRPATINSLPQTISKTATQVSPTEDKSIYSVTLTLDDVNTIISGSIQLVVTIGGVANKVAIPYIVKKSYAAPGY